MALFFFFSLPVVFFCLSIAFDGSNLNSQRSRLSDALNQSALAIAVRESTQDNMPEDKEVVSSYIDFYMHGYISLYSDIVVNISSHINGSGKIEYTDYEVSGNVLVNPALTGKYLSKDGIGFSKDVKVVADSNSGIVRRSNKYKHTPTDYVFVYDFSPSMLYALDLTSEPVHDAEVPYPSGTTKMDILKEATAEFMTDILTSGTNSTVGLVPFSVGVPTIMSKTGSQIGGPVIGCTFAGIFHPEYEHARKNMWFWQDKAGIYWQDNDYDYKRIKNAFHSDVYGGIDNRVNEAKRWVAHSYGFYKNTIGYGYDTPSWQSPLPEPLMRSTWFDWVKQSYSHSPSTRIVDSKTAKNEKIIYPRSDVSGTFEEFIQNKSNFLSGVGLMLKTQEHMSAVNVDTLDISATLDGNALFDPNSGAITEYVVETSPNHSPSYNKHSSSSAQPSPNGEGVVLPFRNMCRFDYYSVERAKVSYKPIKLISARTQLESKRLPPHYLINLTSNLSIVDDFKSMKTHYLNYASTDSSLALLRSVPLLAKGVNPRKVIVMVTDGFDSVYKTQSDYGKGPKNLSLKMHKNYRACDKIKKGFMEHTNNTEEVGIYLITLSSLFEQAQGQENVNFWEDYCVGKGNAFQASNIDDLKNALLKISESSSINFINKAKL